MSGITNLLIAPFTPSASGPTLHPPYSLDALDGDEPPLIHTFFSGESLTATFNYTVPDDGNAYRWMVVVMTGDLAMNDDVFLNYGGQGDFVQPFGRARDSFPETKTWYLSIPVVYAGGPVNDSFVMTRTSIDATSVDLNIRVYTFGDVDIRVGGFSNLLPIPLDSQSGYSDVVANLQDHDAVFQIGARTDYAPGRDTLITVPADTYTYSPTGDQGFGLLTNGAEAAIVEMIFDVNAAALQNTTWGFQGGQTGEGGSADAFCLRGPIY